MSPSIVRLLYISIMKRVPTLLAIYGLLFLITGDLLQDSFIGWSAICNSIGIILVALAVCRMLIDRII